MPASGTCVPKIVFRTEADKCSHVPVDFMVHRTKNAVNAATVFQLGGHGQGKLWKD